MKKSVIFTGIFILVSSFALAENIKMATTTSTQDTGLLDYLAPIFTKDTGHNLEWVSVGSGQAIKHGESCDVDVLLVHSPAAEEKFMQAGFGQTRKQVMYNDFVIVGPKSDPAKVKGKDVQGALSEIAKTQNTFVSRGDESGTHAAEKTLWKNIGATLPDKEKWYLSVGQGMINTLNVAAEKQGYTLSDRGTFIKYSASKNNDPDLVIITEGDPLLFNQYSVILINPAKCPETKVKAVEDYINWLTSPNIQKTIGDYKMEGKQLFFPNAAK